MIVVDGAERGCFWGCFCCEAKQGCRMSKCRNNARIKTFLNERDKFLTDAIPGITRIMVAGIGLEGEITRGEVL